MPIDKLRAWVFTYPERFSHLEGTLLLVIYNHSIMVGGTPEAKPPLWFRRITVGPRVNYPFFPVMEKSERKLVIVAMATNPSLPMGTTGNEHAGVV